MAGGRPTKYKPEYPEALIEHMNHGLSFESFAGTIAVSREVLYLWEKTYPEFMHAKKAGTDASLLFWERIGVDLALGNLKDGKAAIWIFIVCNRFQKDYSNKHIQQIELPKPVIIKKRNGKEKVELTGEKK